ncbi:MAG: ABC transporter permease [Bryobacteraceae bacterium]
MESFLQDLKHSIRMFLNSPGFTLTAVLALALGVGANTAIFSVINTVLLRPMPYPDPDRFVFFTTVYPDGSGTGGSAAMFNFWKAQTDTIEYAAAWRFGVANYNSGGNPEQVQVTQASADFFPLCGATALYGRTFSKEEDLPGGPKVAVLAYGFWQRRFASDPNVIGKTLVLSGAPYEIIGITGPSLKIEIDEPPDIYTPMQIDPNSTDQARYFNTGGHLKAGVSVANANARFKVATEEFRRKYPTFNKNVYFGVDPLRESLVRGVRTLLLVLLGAVSFVLLIACANVANLLLARATGRRREMAIRAAVGAGRGRIIRQLLTESVLLSIAGGLVGLVIGYLGIKGILSINPGNIPRVGQHGSYVTIDWRVVLFTMGVAFATGILFGLIPALQASRTDLSSTIKESTGRGGTSFRHNKARSLLVITEVALALVLLIGAALLLRTFAALRAVNPGFTAHNVLTLQMLMNDPRFATTASVDQVLSQGRERLKAIPGVESAAATCCVPLQGGFGLPFIIVGRPLDGTSQGGGRFMITTADYLDVFKIPLLRGRVFNDRDGKGADPVVVINQTMAKRFWKDGDPLADQLIIGRGVGADFEDVPRQIIGVVSDIRDDGLESNPNPTMYVPQAQLPDGLNKQLTTLSSLAWVVRTKVEPRTLIKPIQKELTEASGGLALAPIRTMDEIISQSTATQDFNTLALTIFAGTALLLAAIGIYGLMAYTVEQRTQEIGIRLALGAEYSAVRNMIVFQGMRLALIGVIIGVASSFALTKLIASLLYGVQARDPMVFIGVPVLLSLVALIAVWVPARRATRVSPMDALRCE